MSLKSPGLKIRNPSQSYKFNLMSNPKMFGNLNDDVFSGGFSFSPVANSLYNGTGGKKSRMGSSMSSFVPVPYSGPTSPAKDNGAFSPIFFGTGNGKRSPRAACSRILV